MTWGFATKNTASYSNEAIPLIDSYLLLESASRLLQESGSFLILEQSVPVATEYSNSTKNTAVYSNEIKN